VISWLGLKTEEIADVVEFLSDKANLSEPPIILTDNSLVISYGKRLPSTFTRYIVPPSIPISIALRVDPSEQ